MVYNDTPTAMTAGIWMSGQAPAADADGNLYLSIGNGTVGTPANRRNTINRGESFLKLTRNGTNLIVASWFTPYNFTNLENWRPRPGLRRPAADPGHDAGLFGRQGGHRSIS